MRPSRPTDHAARFTCRRAEFTTFAASARAPAPPRTPRPAHTGRPCTLPRPA